ncbi:GNAT family N-acetyltransferase [Nocardia sp. BSTN01]|uniref:GNAT family N-acetyltransferase n=1 Tax=Nocardia sp. BSTN01 TaxID=2783665 RepID=UPI00188EC5B3|nr:GNAT family N-acetyltransferase [Nocardia sp. BSTN01]MBF4999004.1 GNAT family N-acetyltransferase [Nocardia sp. BSTN01]
MTQFPDDVEFEHLDAGQARKLKDIIEDIYRRSYADVVASGELFDTPEQFMARFDAYTDPARSNGFELVISRVRGNAIGQAWGWPLTPQTAWWDGLNLDSGDTDDFTAETGTRTFALSEIMVCQEHTGHGLAHALHDELLRNRSEERATLLVEPENTRAYNAYLKWGWQRVGHLRPNWPDAPLFDVLIMELAAQPERHQA